MTPESLDTNNPKKIYDSRSLLKESLDACTLLRAKLKLLNFTLNSSPSIRKEAVALIKQLLFFLNANETIISESRKGILNFCLKMLNDLSSYLDDPELFECFHNSTIDIKGVDKWNDFSFKTSFP